MIGIKSNMLLFFFLSLIIELKSLSQVWLFVTPKDCSLPGSSIYGIFQARVLVQFSSVTQSCPTLCDLVDCSQPGIPVHHQLPELTQTHVHWVSDAIQPSHPLSSPSPPILNLSQHLGLFKWVSSSHQVARLCTLQLIPPVEVIHQTENHLWSSCYDQTDAT